MDDSSKVATPSLQRGPLPGLDLSFIEDGRSTRSRNERRRTMRSFAAPLFITVTWVIVVVATNSVGRVGEHFLAAVTMVFGSFVAGSTPQGGGAVAFPVFTKALSVPAETARSFSLCIQAIGMTSASLAIIAGGRTVAWRAIALAAPSGIIGLILTLLLLGDSSAPFWPSSLPGPYVKVTFTLVVAAMAWVVFVGLRTPIRSVTNAIPDIDGSVRVALIVGGLLGGVASAMVGSGADVFTYIVVVILLGVRSSIGVPTAVITMAIVSVAGFVMVGLLDGQLFVELATVDGEQMVAAVGGHALAEPTALAQADLFGMWLAAIPIVAWGAPAGAWVAARMTPRMLLGLALTVAAAEIISTLIFLDDLRTDPVLAIYAAVGAIVAIAGITLLAQRSRELFGLSGVDYSESLKRSSVEVAPTYQRDIAGDDR